MNTFKYRKTVKRNKGSIIFLTCIIFAMIALLLVVAYSFSGLYFVRNRLQSSANEIALAGAKKLNEKDRLGQMNNAIALCRQLVYSSRQDYEKTKNEFKELETFAEPLLKESRESADTLESERKVLTDLAKRESLEAMQEQFDSIKASYAMTLPWLQISSPQMISPQFGKIDGLESNVEELTQIKALATDDRNQNNVDVTSNAAAGAQPGGGPGAGGLNLYKGEKNHKLSGSDNDLSFKMSSLPAPVKGVISPTRILLTSTFKNSSPSSEYAPPAAQVLLRLKVETGLGPKAEAFMESRGTAITTGASSQI